MGFKKYLFVLFFFSAICASRGQVIDTAVYLLPVTIQATKAEVQHTTNRVELLDTSAYARLTSSSISDLLNRESGLFIKSYGAGALATVSLRGSAAAHTAVYWNGFNLQSPMHGVTDLSLIPSFLIDNVNVQYGGNGALGGSGSLGGAIHLKQNSFFDKGLQLQILSTVGSFGHYKEGVAVGYGGKKFTTQTRFYHEQAKNNFPYRREYDFDKITVKQTHAANYQNGFSQDNNFLFGNSQFGIYAFYIESFKQIPPLMNAIQSTAEEVDKNARVSANWQLNKKKYSLNMMTGYLTEQLNYNDSITKLYTKSNAASFVGEASILFHPFKYHVLRIGISRNSAIARADGYQEYKHREQLNATAAYQLNYKERLTLLLGLSKEFLQGHRLPLLPSAGAKFLFNNCFSAKLNAASVYRLPTLNDLYWQPGGNINLQPESGFVSDAAISFLADKKNFNLAFEIGGFNNKINNWIIWLPDDKQVWSPDNVNKVWSRGLEASGQLAIVFDKVFFRCKANYEYVLSTNEWVSNTTTSSLHKQLIYTPRIQSKIISSLSYKGFELHYNHSYTGYRYVTSDNEYFLQPFTVGEVGLLKTFYIKHVSLQWNITVQNVWDARYQVIAFYAIPGRHYETGILVTFGQK